MTSRGWSVASAAQFRKLDLKPCGTAATRCHCARERVELYRIGVNLNQIARALNSGASAPAGTLEAVERVGELAADLLSGEGLG